MDDTVRAEKRNSRHLRACSEAETRGQYRPDGANPDGIVSGTFMWKNLTGRLLSLHGLTSSKIDFRPAEPGVYPTRRKNLLLRDKDELVNQQLAKMLFKPLHGLL